MADEKQYRNFAQERRPGHDGGSSRARSHDVDPLAELARLIGQTDPFGDGRDPRTAPAARPSVRPRNAQPAVQYDRDDAPRQDLRDASNTSASPPERSRHQAPSHAAPPRIAYPAAPPAPPTYPPAYAPAPAYDEAPDANAYGHAQYAGGYEQAADGYDDHAQSGARSDDGYYGEPDYAADENDGMRPAYPRRSQKLLIGVAAVAIVLLGAAGAFGYRAIYGHLSHSGPPPVIKAETTPAKVAPAKPAAQQQSKMIYSRLGSDGKDEHIVSREEKPVDIKPVDPASALRTAPPPESALSPAMSRAMPAGAVTAQAPISASGGIGARATAQSPTLGQAPNLGPSAAVARKIHTVTIRPNQPFVPPAPATGPRSEAQPAEHVASAEPAPVATPPWPPEPQDRPHQVRTQTIHTSNNAPLSLSPTSNAAPARPAAASRRIASTGSAPAGSYAVQLTSHRTEGEARTAFHRLQGKFPSLLGNRDVIIRRADLGAKGIYYRAMVGPFATVGEATGFCGNLKSSGGQCVVQRN